MPGVGRGEGQSQPCPALLAWPGKHPGLDKASRLPEASSSTRMRTQGSWDSHASMLHLCATLCKPRGSFRGG